MITVLTAAIPERMGKFLPDVINDFRAQDLQPAGHLIGIDYDHLGPGPNLNRLAEGVSTPYMAITSDDDRFYPNHLSTLYRGAEESGADITWTWCDSVGFNFWQYNQDHFDRELLRSSNTVGAICLIRTETFQKLGIRWKPVMGEDWVFMNDMADAGATFHVVPQKTWAYCIREDSRSHRPTQ